LQPIALQAEFWLFAARFLESPLIPLNLPEIGCKKEKFPYKSIFGAVFLLNFTST